MNKFIKVCHSIYGSRSCIYRFVNPTQIVEFHIAKSEHEVNIEALLTSGESVIILDSKDLLSLVGDDYFKEIMEKFKEITNELGSIY